MKKCFLLLPLLFLFSACSAHPPTGTLQTVCLANEDSAYYYDLGQGTAAVAFTANTAFSGAEMNCFVREHDNRLTLTLYSAKNDYSTTVSGKALRRYTFTETENTGMLTWKFEELPAGSYLLTISETKGISVSKAVVPSEEANGQTVHFLNGEPISDGLFQIRFLFSQGEPMAFFTPFSFPTKEES